MLKPTGIAIRLGALVDAILVPGVLVPAVMAVLGPSNWWAQARIRPPQHIRASVKEGES